MIEELLRQDRELKRAKINSETAKLPWQELERFFAAGKVMHVSPGIDLVDVAYALELDDVEQVKNWTEAMQLQPVSDQQARDWINNEASLWAVVIKPWVLVQEPDH
ncbi:MAG: DUF2288 domain-containing protein [Gammaproteobacteria bacterium]|nr:DUF2288 domain-containing protein [Gammaproteobacteria bacterium]